MKGLLQKSAAGALIFLLFMAGCRREIQISPPAEPVPPAKELTHLGHTIQVGAFSVVSNAVRLTNSLNRHGLNAYYFVPESGLYKVRFGNFASREEAQQEAESLIQKGIFTQYFVVSPEDYAVAKESVLGEEYLRDKIIATAQSFIGLPYAWGGTSPEGGFDCSGLTMAVYQLNGLNLPRSSQDQWETGTPIPQGQLLKGDLVFFDTSQKGKATHVGIYTGQNMFVHAPGKNKIIRKESLSGRYFRIRFIGARTYLK